MGFKKVDVPDDYVPDSGIGDFRSPEVIAAAERGDLIYLDKCKGDKTMEVQWADKAVPEEPEIPRELFSLESSLKEQEEVVKALREALTTVTRCDEAPEEKCIEVGPLCYTELGGKLMHYRMSVDEHTNQIKYLLRNLEL